MYWCIRLSPSMQHSVFFAAFLTYLACVCSQETYEVLPNGTIVLDPPPPQTNSVLLAFSNPSYLSFIYSSTDGISNGISSGLTPILDSVLAIGNSSCIVDDPNAFVEAQSVDSTPMLTWLIGIVVLSVFGMCMCVSVLITCCIVCCCRICCSTCGAERSQKISPRCTLINLCVWSPILIGMLIMSIFGCIFGILSYASLNVYITNAPNLYDNSLSFINDTLFGLTGQLEFTLSTQLGATFNATLEQVTEQFDTSFGDRLDGLIEELNSSVGVIDQLKVSATNLETNLNDARNLVTRLNDAATDISTDLTNIRNDCTTNGIDCSSVPASISTGLDASSIPDISSTVTQLNSLNTSDLTDVVSNITTRIDSEINTLRGTFANNDLLSSIDIGSTFSQISSTVGQNLSSFSFNNILVAIGQDPAYVLQTYDIAGKIVLAVVIMVFVVIIITLLFALVGLVITFFGYDSEAKASTRSGLSNAGANLLALSGYISLGVTWILIPILVTMFTLGSILTTLCQPLVDQSILSYISPCVANLAPEINAGEFGNVSLQINISFIFESCQRGDSLLSALQADDLADSIIADVSNIINNEVGNLSTQINPDVISDGIIDSYMMAIEMYDTSDFNFDTADSITADLNTAMATQGINDARAPIMNLIAQIDASPSTTASANLRASAVSLLGKLDDVENELPEADNIIASTTGNLMDLTNGLNEVNQTLTMAFATVTEFAANLTTLTTGLISGSITTLQNNANTYLQYVRNNIPQCRFLTDFYTAFVDVFCLGVLRNFNALWFCLGWALIFLLLSGIFSFIVARYAVRREHESWMQQEDDGRHVEDQDADKRPVSYQATAPTMYLDANIDQPPPNYTYMNQNIEMKLQYLHPENTPVLTQMRGGEVPHQPTW